MKILYIRRKTPEGMRHNYNIEVEGKSYVFTNFADPPAKTLGLVKRSLDWLKRNSS